MIEIQLGNRRYMSDRPGAYLFNNEVYQKMMREKNTREHLERLAKKAEKEKEQAK